MVKVKDSLSTHALNIHSLSNDLKSDKISELYYKTILDLYDQMLINYSTNPVSNIAQSLLNSLLTTGYYIDYASINRSHAIETILK